MEKQEFIEKYSIGELSPTNPTSKLVYASALAEAIGQFIDERFRAAAEVKNNVKSNERVLISDEYTAHFLKLIFTAVFGRVYLYFTLEERQGKIALSITSDEPFPISKKEMDAIIRTARNAGLEVESVGGGIFAYWQFVDERQFSVYASTLSGGKSVILKKLEEMFFGTML